MSKRLTIIEPTILIRINQFYRKDMSGLSLYEATRGVWKVGIRREKVTLAMAIYQGLVKEVYEIHSWSPAGTTPYETRHADTYMIPERWEFVGRVADPKIRERYFEKSVEHYFSKGAQNPIMYVNA